MYSNNSNNVLFNLSNLHHGGGLQVAISFVDELSRLPDSDFAYTLIVSSEVHNGLQRLGVDLSVFSNYQVIDTIGLNALWSPLNQQVKQYDVVFTLFGPNYLRKQAKLEIVGFAQSWILKFDNPISQAMPQLAKIKLRLKFYVQRLLFKRSDKLIVELEHVKQALIKQTLADAHDIYVVHNTISLLYLDQSKWSAIRIPKQEESLSIGIVTRDYPHKNLAILPELASILLTKFGLTVHFYVSLNEQEWSKKTDTFKRYVSTVGALSVEQCPSFYQQMDAVIFPSLLECFSATPLEALVMKKPLFASDREFVKDVCAQYAYYFDPTDALAGAQLIANYFASPATEEQLEAAYLHTVNFSNATQRANSYLQIIRDNLEQ
jgi:glycosyltransferase involved in cell wall biosynthesis